MRLIFSLGANRRFSSLARRAGWWSGARLPATLYTAHFPLAFADQNWNAYQRALERSPQAAHRRRAAYMRALKAARPAMASVLDWERAEQLEQVLDWAAEAAAYAQTVMLIPKVVGAAERLPDQINGRRVVLGYSIPTTHGGTRCGLREFHGRRVHLLGGSPRQQLQAAQLLGGKAEVVSADGNMCHRAAGRGTYWSGQRWRNDGAYATTTEQALWRSLLAIGRMWQRAGWQLEQAPRLADEWEAGLGSGTTSE